VPSAALPAPPPARAGSLRRPQGRQRGCDAATWRRRSQFRRPTAVNGSRSLRAHGRSRRPGAPAVNDRRPTAVNGSRRLHGRSRRRRAPAVNDHRPTAVNGSRSLQAHGRSQRRRAPAVNGERRVRAAEFRPSEARREELAPAAGSADLCVVPFRGGVPAACGVARRSFAARAGGCTWGERVGG